MKRLSLVFTVVIVLAGSGLLLWSRTVAGASRRSPAPGETGVTAELVASPAAVAAPGRVEPISEEIDLAAEIAGRLHELLVDEGDAVARGQVIARLADEDYLARVASARASVAIAEAELLRLTNGARPEERREAEAAADQAAAILRHAESELARRRDLMADGIIAREELERAERDVEVARARSREGRERALVVGATARDDERARAQASVLYARSRLAEASALLAKTTIVAPIDGMVVRRHRQAGESVSPESPQGAVIVTLADTRVLRVRVDVDERDIARLRVGQPAFVTADAYGPQRFHGRVVRIGQILGRKSVRTDDPAERVDTKVLETLIELEAGARLPVGLRVDAVIGS